MIEFGLRDYRWNTRTNLPIIGIIGRNPSGIRVNPSGPRHVISLVSGGSGARISPGRGRYFARLQSPVCTKNLEDSSSADLGGRIPSPFRQPRAPLWTALQGAKTGVEMTRFGHYGAGGTKKLF